MPENNIHKHMKNAVYWPVRDYFCNVWSDLRYREYC